MSLQAHFTYKGDGLKVSFKSNTSTGVTPSDTFKWEFGDNSTSTDQNPDHTYNGSGFFLVKLTITAGSETESFQRTIGVANTGQPLSKPLYQVVDDYLPAGFTMDPEDKEIKIQKWQLFLSALVNHEIPLEDIYDEFAYTPLENTLVAQLIAYEQIIEAASKYLITTGQAGGKEIKKMVQGPMETEWFQGSDSLSKVFKKGGSFESLAQAICGLAKRLRIYIPGICPDPGAPVIPFIVSKIDTHGS